MLSSFVSRRGLVLSAPDRDEPFGFNRRLHRPSERGIVSHAAQRPCTKVGRKVTSQHHT